QKVYKNVDFVSKNVWFDEATFKLNGTVNRLNCVYWAPENPHIHVDRAVNLPGLTVWCELSYRGLTGPLFFEGTVNTPINRHLSAKLVLQTFILLALHQFCGNKPFYFQQDGASPRYYRDVITYLNEPGQWMGRGSVEYPPCSSDLTLIDFYLWESLKDVVYCRKPLTLETLREEIETLNSCLPANGGHF
ncbi:hypothetical protein B7P43_G14557, partial [Cryptotermes secundus]